MRRLRSRSRVSLRRCKEQHLIAARCREVALWIQELKLRATLPIGREPALQEAAKGHPRPTAWLHTRACEAIHGCRRCRRCRRCGRERWRRARLGAADQRSAKGHPRPTAWLHTRACEAIHGCRRCRRCRRCGRERWRRARLGAADQRSTHPSSAEAMRTARAALPADEELQTAVGEDDRD